MRKVLLIEDTRSIGEELKEGISRQGFKVDWAKDGREGLEMYYEKNYDLVVSDLRLPEIDGLGIVANLNISKPRPTIYLASSLPTSDMELAQEKGLVDRVGHKREIMGWLRQDYASLRSMLIVEPVKGFGDSLSNYLEGKQVNLNGEVYTIGSAQAVVDPHEALDRLLNEKPGIIVACPQLTKEWTGAEILGWAPTLVPEIERANLSFSGAKERYDGSDVTPKMIGEVYRIEGV